jgi:hypothetical protein
MGAQLSVTFKQLNIDYLNGITVIILYNLENFPKSIFVPFYQLWDYIQTLNYPSKFVAHLGCSLQTPGTWGIC